MNDDELRERVRRALDSVHRPDPGLVRRSAEAAAGGRRGRRLGAAVTTVTVTAVVVSAVAVALVRHEDSRQIGPAVPTPTASISGGPAVYSLTAANQVVAVDARSRRARWTAQVAPPPSSSITPGAMLGISEDGTHLYVLPAQSDAGGTSIHVLDAASGRAGPVIDLGGAGGPVYRALAVHPKTGELYVVGQDASHLVVSVVDPARAVVLSTTVTRTLPPAAPFIDLPYQAALTADGSRLYYSYGPGFADRRGIDWADVRGPALTPCHAATPGAACISSSPGQGFVVDGANLLFADNSIPAQLVQTRLDGTVVSRSSMGLQGTVGVAVLDHAGSRQVVALATCDSQGGLNRVDRATGQVTVVVTPAPAGSEPGSATLCGVRPALLSDGTLAMSQVSQGKPTPELTGTLLFANSTTGHQVGTVALPAQAVDVLAVG